MKRSRTSRYRGITALELIEEATSLLRGAPAEALALYYLGTFPFMLGGLYFWADMSCNADASGRLAGFSLALALLFIWMKYWQSRFCGELYRLLMNGAVISPPARSVALAQTVFQPWGFVILPVALLVTIPFGFCFAFFQNITVLGGDSDLRRLYGRARCQAMLRQGQNHTLMVIFLLLGLVVFSNLCLGAFFLPRILKALLGVESIFSRGNLYLFNSTFWAAMAALTHLCVDPLLKTVYLLRCHYGESLASGADLLAELKEVRLFSATGFVVLLLSVGLLCGGVSSLRAAESVATGIDHRPLVNAGRLDKTIGQVIDSPEFAWRFPRSEVHNKKELPGFVRSALKLLKKWADDAGEAIKRFLEWLIDILPRFKPKEETAVSGGVGLQEYVFILMYGLLAVCLCCCGVFLLRHFRGHRKPATIAAASHVVMEPDLSDESVTADELSEQRWSDLASDLLARGELRLALRALYLACLACLAEERLISIARFKSDRDYERELRRFAHSLPDVMSSFSSNRELFERAWYGRYKPEPGMIELFKSNNERISSGVRQE